MITLDLVYEKVKEAITDGKNVLTLEMAFDRDKIIVLCILSILFLFTAFFEDKNKWYKDALKFLGWVINLSISAIFIYLIILIPYSKDFFNLLIILVFFSLFILYKRLEE